MDEPFCSNLERFDPLGAATKDHTTIRLSRQKA